ncbi:MAG: ABC transporter permease [Rhizobiaceae bacterium]|nr:MAG: ABC transporter permease [Rhizobiaceae bacterium]
MRSQVAGPSAGTRLLRRIVETRELTLAVLILAIVVAMSVLSPYFLTAANLHALTVGMTPTAIIAIGMAILLAGGGFDLSVGSVMALSSTVAAMLLVAGLPIPIAVLIAFGVGAMMGIANGLLVTLFAINPLVATLGTMSVARGAAFVLTNGFSISNLPESFGAVGSSFLLGLPGLTWIMLVLVAAFDLVVRNTVFFRQIYFIGANEKAAHLSGINVQRVRLVAYMLSGLLSAVAGVLLASRLMSGTPTAGNGLELQVLAAAVIGGSSLRGGEGTILGAFLGVVFMALINNAMTLLDVSIYWQMIVIGLVLVTAVAVDMMVRRKSNL